VKARIALLAMAACVKATAMPLCPVDGFYPSSGAASSYVRGAVSDSEAHWARDDEDPWFDYIEVGGRNEPGWHPVYEVAVVRSARGDFRVLLRRSRDPDRTHAPTPGVVDARELPAALARRAHRGVTLILARTHYPADLLEKRLPRDVACTDGSWIYATVSALDGRLTELVGEARPASKATEAGAVQALGQALRDYALRRVEGTDLEAALKGVEVHARPDDESENKR
jgi:hypothetical protein